MKKPNSYLLDNRENFMRVYYYPFDKVWRALHGALPYTTAGENQEMGYLETDYVKGIDGWLSPEVDRPKASGLRYKLIFNIVKGTVDGKEATRVSIEKKIEIMRDFFSDPETMISDGLEEKIIFYRIERELLINEALKKSNEEKN